MVHEFLVKVGSVAPGRQHLGVGVGVLSGNDNIRCAGFEFVNAQLQRVYFAVLLLTEQYETLMGFSELTSRFCEQLE